MGEAAFHYGGSFTQPNGTTLPLDLSLFFNLPRAHAVGRPAEIYDVTGGYNTGPGGFTGTVTGSFDGTPPDGTFTGTLTADLPGCTASRQYSGPMTRDAIAWAPGDHVNTCGGATPFAAPVTAAAIPTPPTTSVSSSSTTTSIGGGSSTTSSSIVTSSTTTSVGSTTSSSTSSTTSSTISSTSTSTTSTTVAPQSVLVFTFAPNPVPPRAQSCIPGIAANSWEFTMTIQNASAVPFTLQDWTFEGNPATITPTFDYFAQRFGTNTIGANGKVSGSLCLFHPTATSTQVRAVLTGVGGNGPHESQVLTLAAAAFQQISDAARTFFRQPGRF